MKPLKLCVGASSGGHMTELATLLAARSRWPVDPALVISTLGLNDVEVIPGASQAVIGECDRRHPIKAAAVLARSLWVAARERPDVVITTGSMPLALFSLCCRLFGARIVWIDSVSQIDGLSASGRLIRPFADLFLVQWPELESRIPNARYFGELA